MLNFRELLIILNPIKFQENECLNIKELSRYYNL